MLTGLEPGDAYRVALTNGSAVPVPLRIVIERGSAFEPSARFQTIRDFACAVRRSAEDIVPQAASRAGGPSCEGSGIFEATGSKGDDCCGSAVSSGAHIRAKKRYTALLAASCIAVALVILGAIGLAALSDVFGSRAAGYDEGLVDQVLGSDALPAAGNASGTTGGSSLGKPPSVDFSEDETVFPKEDLVVAESSWHMSNGYISYVIALRNENENMAVDYPAFNIVGRDSEGKITSSDEQVLSRLDPGETMYFSSIAGTGIDAPHSVDFLPIAPDGYQVHQARSESAVFRVTDVSATTDVFGETAFVGEVIWEGGERNESAGSDIRVAVVLRDSAGKLIGGATAFARCSERGVPVAFQTLGEDISNYASIEAYAYAW